MVNAFWLDEDLVQTARWLVDRHVTSSVLENATVLTTAVQVNGYPEDGDLYFSHADHPLTRWATASHANWRRLRAYTAAAAHDEWRYRWDHSDDENHASWAVVNSLDDDVVADPTGPPNRPGPAAGHRRVVGRPLRRRLPVLLRQRETPPVRLGERPDRTAMDRRVHRR